MIWKRWFRSETADLDTANLDRADFDRADDSLTIDRPQSSPAAGSAAPPAFLDQLWRETEDRSRNDGLPRFSASAADEVVSAENVEMARRRLALRDALGASQPVINRESFAGRHDALGLLITAVEQNRVHVVIYGERGIGKTSLAHVFADTAREARYLVLYGSCGSDSDFSTMFRAFCGRIPRLYHSSVLPNTPEAERGDHFDSMLPAGPFGPRELSDVLAGITGTRIIIILDEYDRVANPAFRRDVAELIKNLSDRAARIQLVLTGVAQNLDELIGYAPSIRRNIIGLPMRPLKPGEVREVIAIGEAAASLRYTEEACTLIDNLAGGSPYLVRLLAHAAGLAALEQKRSMVTAEHGRAAVERVLKDWNASLPRRVQANLAREEARTHWPMLIAAARAGSSADGFFTAEDVVTELGGQASPLAIERDLKLFSGPNDLLERSDTAGTLRFRFGYPGVAALLLISSAMSRLTS